MGIADIFEALTAKDRPYKRGKTLSESLGILGKFKENGHIDPDLFEVFVRRQGLCYLSPNVGILSMLLEFQRVILHGHDRDAVKEFVSIDIVAAPS